MITTTMIEIGDKYYSQIQRGDRFTVARREGVFTALKTVRSYDETLVGTDEAGRERRFHTSHYVGWGHDFYETLEVNSFELIAAHVSSKLMPILTGVRLAKEIGMEREFFEELYKLSMFRNKPFHRMPLSLKQLERMGEEITVDINSAHNVLKRMYGSY